MVQEVLGELVVVVVMVRVVVVRGYRLRIYTLNFVLLYGFYVINHTRLSSSVHD
jgi:urea transporter